MIAKFSKQFTSRNGMLKSILRVGEYVQVNKNSISLLSPWILQPIPSQKPVPWECNITPFEMWNDKNRGKVAI